MSSYQYNPYAFNRSIINSTQTIAKPKYYQRSLSNKRNPKYMNRNVRNNKNPTINNLLIAPKTEMTLSTIPTSQSVNLGTSQINQIMPENNVLYSQYRNNTISVPEQNYYSQTEISPSYTNQKILPTKYLTTTYLPTKVISSNQQYNHNTYSYATVSPMQNDYRTESVITNTNIIQEPQTIYTPISTPISSTINAPIDNISYTSQEYIKSDYQPLTQIQTETQTYNYDLNNIATNEIVDIPNTNYIDNIQSSSNEFVDIPQTNTYTENVTTTTTDNIVTNEFVDIPQTNTYTENITTTTDNIVTNEFVDIPPTSTYTENITTATDNIVTNELVDIPQTNTYTENITTTTDNIVTNEFVDIPQTNTYTENIIATTDNIGTNELVDIPHTNTYTENIIATTDNIGTNEFVDIPQTNTYTENITTTTDNIVPNELVDIPQTNTYTENITTTTDNIITNELVDIPQSNYAEKIETTITDNILSKVLVPNPADEIEETNSKILYNKETQNKNKNYNLNSPAQVTPIEPIEKEAMIHQFIHNSPVIQKQLGVFSPIQSPLSNYETQSYNPQSDTIFRLETEVASLRAENEAFRKQILELNKLRLEAEETRLLKEQVEQLSPLKAQVEEMVSMKTQLAELNELRNKVKELEKLRSEVEKINTDKKKKFKSLGKKEKKEVKKVRKIRRVEKQEKTEKKPENKNIEIKNEINKEIIEDKKDEKQIEENKEEIKIVEKEEKTEHNIVNGEIIHNIEELEMLIRNINKSSHKMTLNLIYKASADSDKAIDFHNKCDKAKNTIVLIETDKGKRFGGYTSVSWEGNCEDKIDDDAFVFSLDKMKIYNIIPGEKAIGCYPKFGPVFLGCQIKIFDNAFKRGGTTFEKGLNYNTTEDYELTDGDREFRVKDVEVYEVIPQ